MNCPVTIDLTKDDDSDTDSCVAEVAAYIRSTPARPPSSNGIVDLTVSPIPVSPRTEGNSSAMHAYRTIDEFSSGLLSPSKKIKTEHSSIGNGSFMLHKVKDEPGTSLYSSMASAATPLPLCNSSDAVPTEHSACRSTNTSTHSYQTAADSEEMILANRLTIPDCISPSTSFYSANQSVGLISPQAQVLSPGPASMQPFNFSDSLDKNRSEGPSCVGASFISPAASVDDTSFAMEVDCSTDVRTPAKGMTVVTPKAPTLLPQPAPPTLVRTSPSAPAQSVSLPEKAASVTSILDKPVSASKAIETDKADELCAQPKAVSSAPVTFPVSVAVPPVEVPVVPCGMQISTILHNLQTVLVPLINLVVIDTNPSTTSAKTNKTANNSTPSDAPSLASSLTVDPTYRTTITTSSSSRAIRSDKKNLSVEPLADSEMQTKKLKYLDKILFPSLHSDTKAAELSQNGEVLYIIEQALRSNFNSPGVMKRMERALQQSDGPVNIYLMLMESKVDVLKQLQRKEGSYPDPLVFGLGSLPSLRALLSRLFHLPTASTEEPDLPRSNHSSGEKSVRGELHNTNNNTNTNNTGNATVGIVAKSSQRKSKISKKASTYTTATNNPTKDFTSESTDIFTHPNTTSFGNSNSKNANLRPGVSIINTNNPIIRTEMDSLRVLAEADSAECAVGLRILNAWIEYMLCVSAHYQSNTLHNSVNTVTNSATGFTADVFSDALRELHAFATEVRNSTTVSTLIDGARRNVNDLDTLAEADAKRAAVLIEELAAALYDVFVSQCVVTNTQISSKSKSSSIIDDEMELIQTESVSEKGYDVLYSVLSLETKLPSPTQWAAEREDEEEEVPYEKYTQELLAQSVSLLDAALKPWSPNTGGTIATTSASVHCTALQSRGVIIVRYLLAQLKCILARLKQNLEDVAEKNVVLSELADTPSLRKINTNFGRILKTFLHRVKIVLFYRGNVKDKVGLSDAAKSEDETLCDIVEALLVEHNNGNTSSSNKKRTAESRLIDIINNLTLECRV
eukprot:gene19436-22095_t